MADLSETPRVDWRKLRGGDTIAKPTQPRPPFLERRSTSEGDMSRGSYRESAYDDHSTRAVVNDDGSSITGLTDALLRELIQEVRKGNDLLLQLLGEVVAEGAETARGISV